MLCFISLLRVSQDSDACVKNVQVQHNPWLAVVGEMAHSGNTHLICYTLLFFSNSILHIYQPLSSLSRISSLPLSLSGPGQVICEVFKTICLGDKYSCRERFEHPQSKYTQLIFILKMNAHPITAFFCKLYNLISIYLLSLQYLLTLKHKICHIFSAQVTFSIIFFP